MESGQIPECHKTRFTDDQIRVWREFLMKNTFPKEEDFKQPFKQIRYTSKFDQPLVSYEAKVTKNYV